ncbi:MAG TPA: NAD(P)H-binding protein [Elusimicrobiota bacterium]|nr:NAD(P)H-binding protein [Elusimicrobiota bacterium]
MIVVTAATGHIGQHLVQELLSKKKKVRAVARDAQKLKKLADRGAETVTADLADPAAVARALQGASAVFALIPPSYGEPDFRGYQNKISVVLADAVKNAGVKHVVNLSSLGAHLPDKTGPIKGLYDHERRLNQLDGVHVLHLRPTYFMENFYFGLGLIKGQGIHGSPLLPDVPFPMIATRDIASVAAHRLAALDFMGKSVQELLGPREVTMAEATRTIGAAIGKPGLPYVQFPYADARAAMIGLGMSADVADQFNEMYKAFNEGLVRPTQARGAQTTTPTSIEAFAREFAVAYSQS